MGRAGQIEVDRTVKIDYMVSMTTPPATARITRKRERTRGELVAAAERLVALHGLDAVSIDDITHEADVAKGTFYTHFEDKDDLAAAIGARIRDELEAAIDATNAAVTDPALRMANGLSTVLAYAMAHPVSARALLKLRPGAIDPDAAINTGIRNDVVMGVKAKRFWAASPGAAVVTIMGAAMSAMMRLSDAAHRMSDPAGFAADVIATCLVALGVKPAEATRMAASAISERKKDQLIPQGKERRP